MMAWLRKIAFTELTKSDYRGVAGLKSMRGWHKCGDWFAFLAHEPRLDELYRLLKCLYVLECSDCYPMVEWTLSSLVQLQEVRSDSACTQIIYLFKMSRNGRILVSITNDQSLKTLGKEVKICELTMMEQIHCIHEGWSWTCQASTSRMTLQPHVRYNSRD